MNIQTQTAPSRQVSSALDTSHLGVPFPFKSRYGNFIGGRFVEPRSGRYFENPTPITGEVICEIARSNSDDVEAALDAYGPVPEPDPEPVQPSTEAVEGDDWMPF